MEIGIDVGLVLQPVEIPEDYAKKWNEHSVDFVQLYYNGKKVSDSLYRKGGLYSGNTDGYYMILKYTEAIYKDSITKDPKRKKHLQGNWVILDSEGNEKYEHKEYGSMYLMGGQVYSIGSKYYNIETNELYCTSYDCMRTDNFIFLNNTAYDADPNEKGVMKINKKDGTYEIIN